MQRLARIALEQENQKAIDLFNQFKEIKPFLARHLPPSTLQLFAEPVVKGENNEIVEWYSNLEGQPIRLTDKQQSAALLAEVQNKLASIRALVTDLQNKNQLPADKAKIIGDLLAAANSSKKEIYSVNNQPVIVGWGIGDPPAPPPPPPPPPVVESAVISSSIFSRHRWCCFLLPLLLLLLGLLAWWWFCLRTPQVPLEPFEPIPMEEPLTREKLLDFEPPQILPPKVEEPKAEEIPKEPEVVEEPKVEEPEKELKPVEEKKVEPAKLCTTKVKPEELPQMVMVFDNSPSMLSSLNESDAAMNEFWARWARNFTSIEENRHMLRSPNRLTVAKKAAASIINNVAPNVPIGFVTLSTCPSAHDHGFYGQSNRGALKSTISNIFPFVDRSTYNVLPNRQTGTPLYSGLQQAATMVDGKNKEAFILLISDGENSCDKDQDVCALAAQIARQKPRLKINVVDIGGAKGANCVAHATKGKVFTANNQKQISSMINQAVKPMQTEEVCK